MDHSLSRRTVIAAAPALAVTACAARPAPAPSRTPTAGLLPSGASGVPGAVGPDLLAARFGVVDTFHPVELVSAHFVLASADLGGTAEPRWTAARIQAPYVGVEAEVTDPLGSMSLGLTDEAGARGVRLDCDGGRYTLVLLSAGESTLASGRIDLAAGGSLGLALCENQVTMLARPPGGEWRAYATSRDAVRQRLDFRAPEFLAALGVRWGGALGRARAGVFGMVGLRDPHLVQEADGTPYTIDGHVFVTWTCAGLGFFQQAHWAVFRMDPAHPERMELVSHLFTRRDGRILGDHAGQIVRDGDRWLVANSSWGDFDGSGVGVRWVSTKADLLTGVHVLDTAPLPLPTEVSSWDPAFTRIDGRWVVAFVESPSQSPFDFHPALASTSAASPFEGLQRVGADTSKHQTEGMILARDRVGWKLLASDGVARRYLAYDLAMTPIGQLDAPYGSNIPHACVLALPGGRWMMLTFDDTTYFRDVVGYGGHGSVLVLRS